jgi:hypothetical protein
VSCNQVDMFLHMVLRHFPNPFNDLDILRNFQLLDEKQMADLREHGRQFRDAATNYSKPL